MKKEMVGISIFLGFVLSAALALAAYHHQDEMDADKFLAIYPDKAGTKLDHCALCHSGGQYEKKPGKWVSLGSCQWCHHITDYGKENQNIGQTMNPYGIDYKNHGRNASAITAIKDFDSDADTYSNDVEINADRYPGDDNDDPTKVVAPSRVYTRAQLEAMTRHSQFLLMNASRQTDEYVEYAGVPVESLLQDAGVLPAATGITVYAPDGWSNYYPMEPDEDPELYHVSGAYPESTYFYHEEADIALNAADGWCDYSAPSCKGRSHGNPIYVSGGLKMILAFKRDGVYLDPGILNVDNKLDGEGPYRLLPPQKIVGPPDQGSNASNQDVVWPYDEFGACHNKGAATRTATIIKVEPLPQGTTDIDILEAGWTYVDQKKFIVYGAIDGTDSNGNGVLDSEEGTDPNSDFDGDGTPDFQDTDTAKVRHAEGTEKICLHTSAGDFINVEALNDDDLAVPQTGKPSLYFPYGTTKFEITGLTVGESVTLTLVFPGNVPTTAKYYKIDATNGWHEIPFESNDGDSTITITLTDGDPQTDSDGQLNGTIVDPGALAVMSSGGGSDTGGGGSGGSCFVTTLAHGPVVVPLCAFFSIMIGVLVVFRARATKRP